MSAAEAFLDESKYIPLSDIPTIYEDGLPDYEITHFIWTKDKYFGPSGRIAYYQLCEMSNNNLLITHIPNCDFDVLIPNAMIRNRKSRDEDLFPSAYGQMLSNDILLRKRKRKE